MASLKHEIIYESIEVSDNEVVSPPPAKRARIATPEEVIDLTQSDDEEEDDEDDEEDDGEDDVAPIPAAQLRPAPSPPTIDNKDDAAEQQASPTKALRSAESVEAPTSPKLGVKSSFLQKWSRKDHLAFIKELKRRFDPEPFMRLTGKPVEEILDQFDALYQLATPIRRWAGGNTVGELRGIKKGGIVVLLTQAEGHEEEVEFEDLDEDDLDYLKESLTESDWGTLVGTSETDESEVLAVDHE
ncbi:uncharacterized protein RCC_10807 [Ramularia collo-cygni]|uniref:Myb-like domain-containing protein n=1 Tax=Ramularia collo-cygni TaxID=112498 RepID=A0A2D3V456_9PEZI|nr:uncharacterized protein RCC_10807 [Ramularia collo-cygni]CZT25077.1 uncharacterized protein RCC_10807 [Ramularia collo-cygni]